MTSILRGRSIAWESIWRSDKNQWARADYAEPPNGRHVIVYRSVKSVNEHGRIYMAVIVGGGGWYKIDRLLVEVECKQLI